MQQAVHQARHQPALGQLSVSDEQTAQSAEGRGSLAMQTFLPYRQFARSARCLDRQRLGKQRVECWDLIRVNLGASPRQGWINHPAARMWREHVDALGLYYSVVCQEWISRGYKQYTWYPYDSQLRPRRPTDIDLTFQRHMARDWRPVAKIVMPPWLGREDFHASHRSNLLRKDPEWYGQWGWTESPDLPYVWPVDRR